MTGRAYLPGPPPASWIATARGALLALLSAVSLLLFAFACAAPALR